MSYLSVTFKDIIKGHIFDVHVPNILIGISASIEVPITAMLGRRMGMSRPVIATFSAIASLSRTLTDIPWGIVVEFVGVRKVMAFSMLLNVLAMMIGWLTTDRVMLAVYCTLSGVSLGGFFLSRHIFVAGISSHEYRGMLMALLSGLLRWAHVLGPLAIGISASYTGDAVNAFLLATAATLIAFTSLMTAFSSNYEDRCTSVVHTEDDEPHALPATQQPLLVAETDGGAQLVPPALDSAAATPNFRLYTLWRTFVDYWGIVWRLGLYVVSFGALRSNRKLMLTLAGMQENLSDAQIAYLISLSFVFDAVFFPLGGLVMDLLGRQYAMVPVVLGLTLVFAFLPLASTTLQLGLVAAGFGLADALGCGLVMTLTADRAPKVHGAPFFGIMRTLQDMGHLVGAGSVSFLLTRTTYAMCCHVLVAQGIFTCCWGLWGVPPEAQVHRKGHKKKHQGTSGDEETKAKNSSAPADYGTV